MSKSEKLVRNGPMFLCKGASQSPIVNTKIRIEITSSNEETEIIEELSVKIEDVEDSFENSGLSQKLNLIQNPPEVKVENSDENSKIEEISNAEGSEDVLIFHMGSEEVKIEDQVFEETDRLWLFNFYLRVVKAIVILF